MNNITIIGGGACGLAVGALLSKMGKKSTIIERNPRVGKKLLSTGNGRCNLGNTNLNLTKYHGDVDLAKEVFKNWKGAQHFFKDLGLICRADNEGRLYPYSNTASSVLDTLRFACTEVEFRCDTQVCELPEAYITVIATGNAKIPFLKHKTVEPFPALCPIITEKTGLKGMRVRAVASAVVNGKVIKSEEGEVQFSENSLSGICIMNLSRLVKDYGNALTISLDIAPEFTVEELQDVPLTGLFHRRIAEKVKNIETAKCWNFPVTRVAENKQSQIMAGGVPMSELNFDLSFKKNPSLYVTGEAVNIDGDCGGYNLEWCWACAEVVVKSIIDKLN
jgi:hypothetical protein